MVSNMKLKVKTCFFFFWKTKPKTAVMDNMVQLMCYCVMGTDAGNVRSAWLLNILITRTAALKRTWKLNYRLALNLLPEETIAALLFTLCIPHTQDRLDIQRQCQTHIHMRLADPLENYLMYRQPLLHQTAQYLHRYCNNCHSHFFINET